MKNKTPLILGSIFILLVIVFLITSYNPPDKSKGATQLFDGDKPTIDKIELMSMRNGHIVVEKINDVWDITVPFKYKASDIDVMQTLNSMLDMVVDGIISNRPEAQEEFNVSEASGTAFKAYSEGKIVLDAIVGKRSSDLTHTYARMVDSKEIMLWRGLFSQSVVRNADEWRDKTIYSFNADDIISVKAVDGDATRELALTDSTWTYNENGAEKPIDQNNVKQFIPLISMMYCDAFADENDIPKIAQNEPDVNVSFKVRNGDTHVFDIWIPGEEDDSGRYFVRKKDGDIVFRFYRYRGSQLVIDYDRLK